MFAIDDVETDTLFREFLDDLFPPYTQPLVGQIEDFYPIEAYEEPLPQKKRFATFIRDAVITCNVRWASNAYSGEKGCSGSYNMLYQTVPLLHGADLLAHFLDPTVTFSNINVTIVSNFMKTYKDYYISFYKTGDPNAWNCPGVDPRPTWQKVVGAGSSFFPYMRKVMLARGGSLKDWQFVSSLDLDIPKDTCEFWLDMQAAMTSTGGYAPPGDNVESPFDPKNDDPSRNYDSSGIQGKLMVQEL